jgi:hypothetical protein
MRQPDDVLAELRAIWSRRQRRWLCGEGNWPLRVSLQPPTELTARATVSAVQAWAAAWRHWNGPGTVEWVSRRWPQTGEQRLPAALVLTDADSVAACVSARDRWERATTRVARVRELFPTLATSEITAAYDALTDYDDDDFERLLRMVRWVQANPRSGRYLRELPIPGIDTKWAEARKRTLATWLLPLLGERDATDFAALCGLRRAPHTVRCRLLCPTLRAVVGGLSDIQVPLMELSVIAVQPQTVLIVENVASGLSLPDRPGTIAILGLGNAVSALQHLEWLVNARAVYWGDLDTHGFAILARARAAVPHLTSVMMDTATISAHLPLAVVDGAALPWRPSALWTQAEAEAAQGLATNRWGQAVRIEQERLPWDYVLQSLSTVL